MYSAMPFMSSVTLVRLCCGENVNERSGHHMTFGRTALPLWSTIFADSSGRGNYALSVLLLARELLADVRDEIRVVLLVFENEPGELHGC